ncbi:hypothetical protein KSP40_PGU012381 [Platanthera guangdongensis]|uniref:Uncharacterized protein n=1 Tax=Platanthera guangdongensis TaxID=2320717 RepID=A0ABR2LC51_9ASPA
MDDKDAELRLREAALSASPILQPDFKFSKVTQAQLDKFRELHNRRLHLKGKSKGRPKVSLGKTSQVVKTCTVVNEDDGKIKVTTNNIEASNILAANGKDNELGTLGMRKKKKLHWGLEAKERWERKANM